MGYATTENRALCFFWCPSMEVTVTQRGLIANSESNCLRYFICRLLQLTLAINHLQGTMMMMMGIRSATVRPTTESLLKRFHFFTLVSAFANNSVIQNVCWLAKFCKSYSNCTNCYIICILQKIYDDLELSPMLYQVGTQASILFRNS